LLLGLSGGVAGAAQRQNVIARLERRLRHRDECATGIGRRLRQHLAIGKDLDFCVRLGDAGDQRLAARLDPDHVERWRAGIGGWSILADHRIRGGRAGCRRSAARLASHGALRNDRDTAACGSSGGTLCGLTGCRLARGCVCARRIAGCDICTGFAGLPGFAGGHGHLR
jgi:hypothetical protein